MGNAQRDSNSMIHHPSRLLNKRKTKQDATDPTDSPPPISSQLSPSPPRQGCVPVWFKLSKAIVSNGPVSMVGLRCDTRWWADGGGRGTQQPIGNEFNEFQLESQEHHCWCLITIIILVTVSDTSYMSRTTCHPQGTGSRPVVQLAIPSINRFSGEKYAAQDVYLIQEDTSTYLDLRSTYGGSPTILDLLDTQCT